MGLGEELVATVRKQFESKGSLPGDLFSRLTPSQFVLLFTREREEKNPDKDALRLQSLTAANDKLGREGKRPVVPSWL